jgi:3-oxoacyl-[acyl-carrier protein] reductase
MTDEILRAGERAGQKDLDRARQVRLSGGVMPEQQLEMAMFLVSPRSNHISGRLLHVNDDWPRIAQSNLSADSYTLRRLQK